VSAAREPKASRRGACPLGLAPYIDLANILPPPEELPGAVKGDLRDHYGNEDGDIEALASQFKAFRDYIDGADMRAELPVEVVRRCKSLSAVRAVLRVLSFCRKTYRPKWPAHGILTYCGSDSTCGDPRMSA
jgi:hypothetical protein